MSVVRFDDLEALRASIGADYGRWSGSVTISQEMIDAFARITGDRQWIHVDAERARRESPLGTTIAHGFLVLAMAVVIKSSNALLQIVGHGSALNYGIEKLRFLRPVPADTAIHGRTRIEAVESRDSGTLVTIGVALHALGSEAPALVFSWKLLYRP